MSAGVLNQFSFKKESEWGTAVTPDKSVPIHMTGGVSTDVDLQTLENSRAVLASATGAFIGARVHEGDLEFDLFPDYLAYLFASALGGVDSAAHYGETTVYDHTLTEAETKPSMTIEQVVGDNSRRFAGAIAAGFKVSAKAGEIVQVSFPIKAKSQASQGTPITATYTTLRPFNFADAKVKIGGSTIAEATSFEFEYKNQLDLLHALNANDPAFAYVGPSEINFKLEFYLDSTTLAVIEDYLAKTARAVVLEITGDAVGNGAHYAFTLTIPTATFKTAVTEFSKDYNKLAVEGIGVYDPSTSKLLDVVITNTLANLN